MIGPDSSPGRKNSSLTASILANKTAYLMLLPVVLSLFIFNYLPMFGLQIAFKNFRITRSMWTADWVGFKWFIQFFNSRQFFMVVSNTLTISFITLLIGFPLPIILALILSEIRYRSLQRGIQTITYMPYFVSTVISVALVQTLFSSTGVINEIVKIFNHGENIIFIQDPKWFKFLYFILVIWKFTGFDSIVFFGAIAGIDPQLYEAALIDGAGRLARMWHITIKCIMPTAAIMLILKIGKILNVCWQEILLLQNDLTLSTSEVIQTYVYKRGIISGDYSFGTAIGLLTSVFGFLMVLGSNWLTRKMSDNEVSMF